MHYLTCRRLLRNINLAAVTFYLGCSSAWGAPAPEKMAPQARHNLLESVMQQGSVRVIVGLGVTLSSTPGQTNMAQLGQAQADTRTIKQAQANVTAQLSTSGARLKHQFSHIPYMVYEIDEAALQQLEALPQIVSIQRDMLRKPTLSQSVALIGADTAWTQGASGAGKTLAILDTGVDKFHSFLATKVVSEACYSTSRGANYSTTLCPSGNDTEVGMGAGVNCTLNGCYHGTHVAGIAAGAGDTFSGVAKDADIIAIQVFSGISDADFCSGQTPCLGAYDSDVIQGLERVYGLRQSHDISAVNLSLGGAGYSNQADCDASNAGYLAVITKLTEVGIAVVAASGNNGYSNKISAPGCVSGAISVGATDDNDQVAYFSNRAPFLALMAPGVSIRSSMPNNQFANLQGTSMAAPHVAGAITALAAIDSQPGRQEILSALTNSAIVVSKNGSSYPRIQVDAALALLTQSSNVDQSLTVKLAVDNSHQAYFNGLLVGSSSNWMQSKTYNLNVNQTDNVIAVKAMDVEGIAALLAQVEFAGELSYSDDNWKVSTVFEAGWQQADFDDSHWPSATAYGAYGVIPWKQNVLGFSADNQAQWIWSDDNLADDTVYFRYNLSTTTNTPPLGILTSTLTPAQSNQAYQASLLASGGAPPYNWQVISGQLPAGLVLDGASGEITGTPVVSDSYTFEVQIEDSQGQKAQSLLSLMVEAEIPATLGQLEIQVSADNANQVYFNGQLLGSSNDWQQASNYAVTLVDGLNVVAIKAQDVDGVSGLIAELSAQGWVVVSDSSWKVSRQQQPGWQQADFDDLSWQQAREFGSYGALPWKKRVAGVPDSSQAKWIWSDDNLADDTVYFRYTLSAGTSPQPVIIDTAQLPDGEVKQGYSSDLKASGGTPPYSWLVTSGQLPVGLTLDANAGRISGTPSQAQLTSFSLQVKDDAGLTASSDYSLTIAPDPQQAAPTILDITLSTDNVDEVYFNGQFMGSSSNWQQASHYSVQLSSGINVLAVKATDIDGIAAMIAVLKWADNVAFSDGSWQMSSTEQDGWQNIDFDAGQWSHAQEYGGYGIAPWKTRVTGLSKYSQAKWIWSDNNTDDDAVYFRYVISIP